MRHSPNKDALSLRLLSETASGVPPASFDRTGPIPGQSLRQNLHECRALVRLELHKVMAWACVGLDGTVAVPTSVTSCTLVFPKAPQPTKAKPALRNRLNGTWLWMCSPKE